MYCRMVRELRTLRDWCSLHHDRIRDWLPITGFHNLHENFEITWTVEGNSTVFLDLKIFKGAGWLRSSYLDTATFAKHINAYLLYIIAFNNCVPTAIKRSFITAEIQHHLRRCSDAGDYYNELCKFYNRLRARRCNRSIECQQTTATVWQAASCSCT